MTERQRILIGETNETVEGLMSNAVAPVRSELAAISTYVTGNINSWWQGKSADMMIKAFEDFHKKSDQRIQLLLTRYKKVVKNIENEKQNEDKTPRSSSGRTYNEEVNR